MTHGPNTHHSHMTATLQQNIATATAMLQPQHNLQFSHESWVRYGAMTHEPSTTPTTRATLQPIRAFFPCTSSTQSPPTRPPPHSIFSLHTITHNHDSLHTIVIPYIQS